MAIFSHDRKMLETTGRRTYLGCRCKQLDRPTADSGFTLIELVVVVMILGILATIAISALAGERQAAWDATVKSDLRNAATAATAYALAHNNSFTGMTMGTQSAPGNLMTSYGLSTSTNVSLTLSTVTSTSYVMSGNDSLSAAGHLYTLTTGTLSGPTT